MTEQLVTFETAKLAKEKKFGLNSYTGFVFDENGVELNLAFYAMEDKYARPTQSLLQKWLFEVHSIWVESTPVFSSNEMLGVNVRISSWKFPYIDIPYDGFDVYEGLEMGLQEALRLIK